MPTDQHNTLLLCLIHAHIEAGYVWDKVCIFRVIILSFCLDAKACRLGRVYFRGGVNFVVVSHVTLETDCVPFVRYNTPKLHTLATMAESASNLTLGGPPH